MKILCLTAASLEYAPLHFLTSESKRRYSKKNNYSYFAANHMTHNRVSWERVDIWKQCIVDFDWIFWTGSDAMITNPEIKIESFTLDKADFIFSCDGCGLQSDSWIMRNCEATRNFLERVANWEGTLQNEQDAMQLELCGEKIFSNYLASLPEPRKSDASTCSAEMAYFYDEIFNKSDVRCKIYHQKWLNAYPLKEYGLPENLFHCWKPGDFVCHLPGKTLQERIKFFTSLNLELHNQ